MRSFVTYTLLASASLASAAVERRWEYPETVPALEKRQEPGTPRYQCHEDCGLLITLGREEGYCDNSEWNERYGRCMICANTFEIWVYYSNSVTSAAEECGLSPTPSPSGWTASSTAQEEPTSTEAAAEASTTSPPEEAATTTADETTAAEETTAAGETTAVGSAPTETSTSEAAEVTTGASSAVPTTLATSAQSTSSSDSAPESSAPDASATESADDESSATFTTPGSLGTVGVTPHATPSTVVVSGAAKHFGLGSAVGVAALAMLGLY